ncbi:MAG: HAMP domain-containing sensor histidine kinase [Gemmatimonadota bacterium]
MRIPIPSSFRARVFLVLAVVSLIPTVTALGAGVLALREVVSSTGSAGAWEQVAQSGRTLFDQIEDQDATTPGLAVAAEQHEAALAESVRFSRLYAFLGERVLALLPFFALLLLLLIASLALLTANWFSRGFSRPVDELVASTRSLATGTPIPEDRSGSRPGEIREFAQLREALRSSALELRDARQREIERTRMQSWSDMARMVAHELKNPLTPMRMAAERVARSDEPALASAGEVLRDEIQRLDELARSFAQFGRPPEGPMSKIDLTELISSLGARLDTDRAPIEIETPEHPVEVTGHLQPLERVIRNLVANAQDATEEAGREGEPTPIRILLRQLEAAVEIRVLDRGAGIAADILPRIWEPEFTAKRHGTGLGLPMVRQVVEAHGGSVRAENREGGGAEFTVRLPYLPAGEPS